MAPPDPGEATGHGIGKRQGAQHTLRRVAGEFEFSDPLGQAYRDVALLHRGSERCHPEAEHHR